MLFLSATTYADPEDGFVSWEDLNGDCVLAAFLSAGAVKL
jgi:hypothetical protein